MRTIVITATVPASYDDDVTLQSIGEEVLDLPTIPANGKITLDFTTCPT